MLYKTKRKEIIKIQHNVGIHAGHIKGQEISKDKTRLAEMMTLCHHNVVRES